MEIEFSSGRSNVGVCANTRQKGVLEQGKDLSKKQDLKIINKKLKKKCPRYINNEVREKSLHS